MPGGFFGYLASAVAAALNILLVFLQSCGQSERIGGQLLDP
ncbi:hypothetical protein [Kineosporia mesophila]|nr:hypothetical protein [Kineosporia mesophila]